MRATAWVLAALAGAGLAMAGCDPELNDPECNSTGDCAFRTGTVCSPEGWCVLPEAAAPDRGVTPQPDMRRPDPVDRGVADDMAPLLDAAARDAASDGAAGDFAVGDAGEDPDLGVALDAGFGDLAVDDFGGVDLGPADGALDAAGDLDGFIPPDGAVFDGAVFDGGDVDGLRTDLEVPPPT